MMTDIFQFSNMYTLRRSIQWLADERHVHEECGPYVTLPGTRVYRTLTWVDPDSASRTSNARLAKIAVSLLSNEVWENGSGMDAGVPSRTVWNRHSAVHQFWRHQGSWGWLAVMAIITQFASGFPPSGPSVARSPIGFQIVARLDGTQVFGFRGAKAGSELL